MDDMKNNMGWGVREIFMRTADAMSQGGWEAEEAGTTVAIYLAFFWF